MRPAKDRLRHNAPLMTSRAETGRKYVLMRVGIKGDPCRIASSLALKKDHDSWLDVLNDTRTSQDNQDDVVGAYTRSIELKTSRWETWRPSDDGLVSTIAYSLLCSDNVLLNQLPLQDRGHFSMDSAVFPAYPCFYRCSRVLHCILHGSCWSSFQLAPSQEWPLSVIEHRVRVHIAISPK